MSDLSLAFIASAHYKILFIAIYKDIFLKTLSGFQCHRIHDIQSLACCECDWSPVALMEMKGKRTTSIRRTWSWTWPHFGTDFPISVDKVNVKEKVVVYGPDIHHYTSPTDFTFPLARWAPMQPAPVDPALDLCTRYPLRLGAPGQCGTWSLPDTSTQVNTVCHLLQSHLGLQDYKIIRVYSITTQHSQSLAACLGSTQSVSVHWIP